jgi:hypothetical protein
LGIRWTKFRSPGKDCFLRQIPDVVDGVIVAQDMHDGLEASDDSLFIGTGKAMGPTT